MPILKSYGITNCIGGVFRKVSSHLSNHCHLSDNRQKVGLAIACGASSAIGFVFSRDIRVILESDGDMSDRDIALMSLWNTLSAALGFVPVYLAGNAFYTKVIMPCIKYIQDTIETIKEKKQISRETGNIKAKTDCPFVEFNYSFAESRV